MLSQKAKAERSKRKHQSELAKSDKGILKVVTLLEQAEKMWDNAVHAHNVNDRTAEAVYWVKAADLVYKAYRVAVKAQLPVALQDKLTEIEFSIDQRYHRTMPR